MKSLPWILLVLVLAALANVASAQQDPPNGAVERFFPMVGRVLTANQRQSLLQILAADRAQIRPLEEKLRTSRLAMLNQIAGGNFDENLTRQYAAQSAGAEAALTVILARALSKMQPPLSAQQIAQIKNFDAGRFREARRDAGPAPAPEIHLKLPPSLPTDTNGLPIVN
ncbi:MAG TPA: periplasmic heavy metal sensor [Verrucomicrobiae bacterium]|nr:periplasmic heavy metal sensor [Verrucomicrobiae bacterium]